jgi:hypothetical protein
MLTTSTLSVPGGRHVSLGSGCGNIQWGLGRIKACEQQKNITQMIAYIQHGTPFVYNIRPQQSDSSHPPKMDNEEGSNPTCCIYSSHGDFHFTSS